MYLRMGDADYQLTLHRFLLLGLAIPVLHTKPFIVLRKFLVIKQYNKGLIAELAWPNSNVKGYHFIKYSYKENVLMFHTTFLLL